MIRKLIISIAMGMVAIPLSAQDDDLYFIPKKTTSVDKNVNYESGSQLDYGQGNFRDVDEYNRRGRLKSYYQKIGTDTLGNDIIEFHQGDGTYGNEQDTSYVYPGSEQYYDDSDFSCSRSLSRFDGYYGWYDPYWWNDPYLGYYYSWRSPWFYGGWYDPWYYNSWYGWGYPYWGGWYVPRYYGYSYNGPTGTRNHSFGSRFTGRTANFGNSRTNSSRYANSFNNYGRRGTFGNRNNSSFQNRQNRTANFGRQRYNNQNQTFSQPQSRPSFSTGSFGGGRSGSFSGGGSFGGGSRGGHFGGRR